MSDTVSALPSIGDGARPQFQRAGSVSQASETSQTAQEYISSQLQLEADAREALPYQFDTCTQPLGPLRQLLFSCLTCNPPPSDPSAPYTAAGVCYSCSISCHGEHTLVELFNKRDFECDCGTTRIASGAACTIRPDARGQKGHVMGEKPRESNKYNQNFANRFCGCGEEYDAHTEKGTMFQCLGLGGVEDGGCGEDWWHPECLVGLPRGWWKQESAKREEEIKYDAPQGDTNGNIPVQAEIDEEDPPLPPGFPSEDDFDGLLCYKCVNAFPWLKRYAGTEGFLAPVHHNPPSGEQLPAAQAVSGAESRKRKADDDDGDDDDENMQASSSSKRQRSSSEDQTQPPAHAQQVETTTTIATTGTSTAPPPPPPPPPSCKYTTLPPPPSGTFSLLLTPTFRDHICHCPTHFPLLTPHPQLRDYEETYEPPLSSATSDNGGAPGGGSTGTKSLLDRGEAALNNMDRVRAIEGVMVYNHLKDKVKNFLAPFAESGKVVGAEDIKAYFETLRGDAEAIRAMRAQQVAGGGENGGEDDSRREQGGY